MMLVTRRAGIGKTHWYPHNNDGVCERLSTSTRGFEIRAQKEHPNTGAMEKGAMSMGLDDPQSYQAILSETKVFGPGGEQPLGYKGCTSTIAPEKHIETWLVDKALKFIEHDRDPDRPFFLYVSLDFPHPGFNVPKGYEDLYDINDIPDIEVPPPGCDLTGHVKDWRYKQPMIYESTCDDRKLMKLRYYGTCVPMWTIYLAGLLRSWKMLAN
ncbi:MAG: sulfatase-like hydrolase/transferase [Phycisphaerales bacterium]|nr:sulfatase-like hydrolase/transferase [Phycisphaerales bacterium]